MLVERRAMTWRVPPFFAAPVLSRPPPCPIYISPCREAGSLSRLPHYPIGPLFHLHRCRLGRPSKIVAHIESCKINIFQNVSHSKVIPKQVLKGRISASREVLRYRGQGKNLALFQEHFVKVKSFYPILISVTTSLDETIFSWLYPECDKNIKY